MVDIYVGALKKHYHVHKAILASASDYFHKMFTNGFIETIEQAATLPELDPEVFDCLLECKSFLRLHSRYSASKLLHIHVL
jgi:hypothetical protein